MHTHKTKTSLFWVFFTPYIKREFQVDERFKYMRPQVCGEEIWGDISKLRVEMSKYKIQTQEKTDRIRLF